MSKSSPVVGCLAVACGLLAPAQVPAQARPAPGGQWDEARVRKFEEAAKAAAEQTRINDQRQREKLEPVLRQQRSINEEQERKRREMADAYWKAKEVQNRIEEAAARAFVRLKEAQRQGNTAAAIEARTEIKSALRGTEAVRQETRPIAGAMNGWVNPGPGEPSTDVPPVFGRPLVPVPGTNAPTRPLTERRITPGESEAYNQAVKINEALKNIDLDRIGTDIQPGRTINTVTEKMLDAANRRWDGGSGATSNARAAEIARINRRLVEARSRFAANEARRIHHNANPPNRNDAEAVRRYNEAARAGNEERGRLKQEIERWQRQLNAAQNR